MRTLTYIFVFRCCLLICWNPGQAIANQTCESYDRAQSSVHYLRRGHFPSQQLIVDYEKAMRSGNQDQIKAFMEAHKEIFFKRGTDEIQSNTTYFKPPHKKFDMLEHSQKMEDLGKDLAIKNPKSVLTQTDDGKAVIEFKESGTLYRYVFCAAEPCSPKGKTISLIPVCGNRVYEYITASELKGSRVPIEKLSKTKFCPKH